MFTFMHTQHEPSDAPNADAPLCSPLPPQRRAGLPCQSALDSPNSTGWRTCWSDGVNEELHLLHVVTEILMDMAV